MRSRKPPLEAEGALYVRLPVAEVDKLDRASAALGIAKKDLIAGLVARYVDPDSRRGLTALGALSASATGSAPKRVTVEVNDAGPTLGAYSFQAYDPPEVLDAKQAGDLLAVDAKVVIELAEAGKLPGRKLGSSWRFSRAALIAWLATPEERKR